MFLYTVCSALEYPLSQTKKHSLRATADWYELLNMSYIPCVGIFYVFLKHDNILHFGALKNVCYLP